MKTIGNTATLERTVGKRRPSSRQKTYETTDPLREWMQEVSSVDDLVKRYEHAVDEIEEIAAKLKELGAPVPRAIEGLRPRPTTPPMREVVLEILGEHPEGLKLGDLWDEMVKRGFRSTALKPNQVLYLKLREMIAADEVVRVSGLYKKA